MRASISRLLVLVAVAAPGALGAAPALAAPSDVSAPVIGRSVTGAAGEGGWFRGPVNVRWSVSDPESPFTTAGCDAKTFTAETSGTTVECRAVSEGGSAADGMLVKIDSTQPAVSGAAADRPPDRGGWYNHPFSVAFSGADALSGIAACGVVGYAGPDTAGSTVAGTCRDRAGNQSQPAEYGFRYDATGPRILRRIRSRRPNRRGWYTRPVRYRFRSKDVLSGHGRCAGVTYRGPDGRGAVPASCMDRAGNVTTRAFPVRYDATAPGVVLRARSGGHMAILRWRVSGEARRFVLLRWARGRPWTKRVVYRGRRHRFVDRRLVDRRRYGYKLVAVDRAGNRGLDRTVARPRQALLSPARDARSAAPPVLSWTPVLGARYYNVQLVRDGRTVLSDWPNRPVFHVPASWVFKRRPQALVPGTYTWYVWAALRRGRRHEVGRLVGKRRFTLVPAG